MSGCKWCDLKLVETSDDTLGDYYEGPEIKNDMVIGETARIAKFEHGCASLIVKHDSSWTERVHYRIGNVAGDVEVPTGYENMSAFDIAFCPGCGKEL